MQKRITRREFMRMSGIGVGALGLGLLTGFDTSSASESTGTDSEEDDYEYSESTTLSVWVHTFDNDWGLMEDFNDNPVVAYISDKFNVNFEWQIPATGSESESFSLMLGSGDYTNVFYTAYSKETPDELYEDGVILDLTEYVEEYMPNLMAFLETDETARKCIYNDDGRILYIPQFQNEASTNWGGMIYNRQILVDMTDDNIQFPSGNDEPTTVNDWEYMFELMKEYFEGQGYTNYACLIIPYNGWFTTGDILTGFGTSGQYYVDGEGKVKAGIVSQEFYNYLVKMKDWYAKGYIYQDFASRSSDPFYWPNTSLTYGCVAGVFYGLTAQLGTAMSMEDYDMYVDYYGLTAPLDTDNDATPLEANAMVLATCDYNEVDYGYAVSNNCNEDQLIRWLKVSDYLYGEEGSMMKSYGLTKEQCQGDPVYQAIGIEEDGAYWFNEDGSFEYNPIIDPYGDGEYSNVEKTIRGERLPGILNVTYSKEKTDQATLDADAVWNANGYSSCLPSGVTLTTEESSDSSTLYTNYFDYASSMVPKFIMGTEELTEETFASYVEQVKSLGLDECLEIYQAAYDRYMAK